MDFSGVVRQQLRGKAVIRYTGLLLFGLKRGHVVQRQRVPTDTDFAFSAAC